MKTHGTGSHQQAGCGGSVARLRILVAALIVAGMTPLGASAQSGSWSQNVYSGTPYNWGTPANWTGGIVADGANNTATFAATGNTSGDISINMDAPHTIGALLFDNTTSATGYFIGGTNALTFSNNAAGGPTIQVNNTSMNVGISAPMAGAQGYTKTGAGTLYITGDASGLSGGITIAAGGGTLSATQYTPTSGPVNNPLGSNTIKLAGGTLQLGASAPTASVISTLTASSFTQNMVVGVGQTFANSGITATMDGGTALSGNTWYQYGQNANDVANTNGPGGTNLRSGLPMGTTITSFANPTINYQMRPTGTNNALLLDAANPTGTMTFTVPVVTGSGTNALSFLSSTGNGGTASTITAVLHYSDGTPNATVTFAALDWFGNSPIAVGTSGRIASGAGVGTYNNITSPPTLTSSPTLYDMIVTNPNPTDPISSVTLSTNAASTQHTAIMAIGGTFVQLPSTPVSPGTINAQNFSANNIQVTGNSTISVATAAGATVGGLTIGANTLTVTGTGALTTGAVTLTGSPTFSVANGMTLATGAFSDGGSVQTITWNGAGTATVPASPGLSAGTNLLVSGPTVNMSAGNSFGASPNVTVNSGNLTVPSGPATFATLSGSGGTVTLNGATVTLTSNSPSSYAGAINDGTTPGALSKTGAGALTLSGTSTFSGGITVPAGQVVSVVPGALGSGPITLSGGTISVGGVSPNNFNVTGTGWKTNGTATFTGGGALQLTPNAGNAAGSAWFSSPVPTGPFTASFTYTVPSAGAPPADGFTFGFQNQGLTALGGAGGSLGYTGITPSVAMDANIYPPNTVGAVGSGIGIVSALGTTTVSPGANTPATAPVNLGTVNAPTNVQLTYNGTNVAVTLTQGTNVFSTSVPVNIASFVGPSAFFGFTGGTGGAEAQQVISNFVFTPTTPITDTYANAVIATTATPTILVASPAGSSVALGPLTLTVPNSTVNISADPSVPANQAYGLGFGATTLDGATTFNVPSNGTGVATLSLGTLNNGPGTGSITITGGANLILTGGGSINGRLTLNNSNLSVQGTTSLGSLTGASSGTLNNGSANNVMLTIGGDNTSGTYGGTISNGGTGTLGLTKIGTGTLSLTGTNTYSGGTIINDGILSISSDGAIGSGGVSVGPLGTLSYSASTSTTKSFITNGGTIAVGAGAVLTLNGSSISSAFLGGAGTFSTGAGAGAQFANDTSLPSATIVSNNVGDRFVNFTNSAALNVAEGLGAIGTPPTGVNFSGFTNQGLGSITVASPVTPAPAQTGAFVNVSNFQSYGTLTVNPATVGSGQSSLITNVGTSAMYFNSGSRTFIGTPATATSGGSPTFVAGIDLEGKNLVIAGGLFVNNGYVSDFSSGTKGSIIVDYGSLYKGAGFTGVSIVTQNGGRVQAGNSPGASTFASLTIGPGALNAFNWEINDAGPSATFPNSQGVGGPQPNASNQVSGWSQEQAIIISQGPGQPPTTGNLTWTASSTAGNQFQLALFTLMNPSTVGQENYGQMAEFDSTHSYMWPFLTYKGTYTGPTDSATLTADTLFDPSQFLNTMAPGSSLSLALVPNTGGPGGSIDIVYSVPEPGTLALVGLGGLALGWTTRRRRAKAAADKAAA